MDRTTSMAHFCVQCAADLSGSHSNRLYCSTRCKAAYRRANPAPPASEGHHCRMCGTLFKIEKGQHNKWLCSPACRRASNNKSVRTFHERKPHMEPIYRERTKSKKFPEGNLVRFYKYNPDAPRSCEACGENRVLDVAHKPTHRRLGEWRSSKNCKWPGMVWVLCPTCHCLLDRMHYPPADLGLKV